MNYQEQIEASRKKREKTLEDVCLAIVSVTAEAAAEMWSRKEITQEQALLFVKAVRASAERFIKS